MPGSLGEAGWTGFGNFWQTAGGHTTHRSGGEGLTLEDLLNESLWLCPQCVGGDANDILSIFLSCTLWGTGLEYPTLHECFPCSKHIWSLTRLLVLKWGDGHGSAYINNNSTWTAGENTFFWLHSCITLWGRSGWGRGFAVLSYHRKWRCHTDFPDRVVFGICTPMNLKLQTVSTGSCWCAVGGDLQIFWK